LNMDMAHIHKKMKKGRPYYYVRETARVDGKPRVVNQVYLGSPERLLEMATSAGSIERLQVQEYGSLLLADLIEKEIGFAGIVDEVVGQGEKKTGPSMGAYFLYAVYNRMIDARSKRALPEWYKNTAIQHIRPVQAESLSSRHYWRMWERIDEKTLQKIAERFFSKLAAYRKISSECFLFDTTNYYTYMASDSESELARRGKNKEGKNWLRQVGVALLVSRDEKLPLYYQEYAGNRHDSKLFFYVLDSVVAAMRNRVSTQAGLTIVLDKGMNSEDNMAILDSYNDIRFITTYSTYYAEELIQVKADRFQVVGTEKNRRLAELGREDDRLSAWRTTGEYWGRERTVVVTYNPLTATKQRYNFEKKLLKVQDSLFVMQDNVRRQKPHWRSKEQVQLRYEEVCAQLHLPDDLYTVELSQDQGRLHMNFRKNHYRINRYIDRFGKNILITDNMDWSTDDIVRASLDRYIVEEAFRQSKDDDLVSLMPLRHWTDSKIRCHILTCIVALAYLRILQIRLAEAEVAITANRAMDSMRTLHSCLVWQPKKRNPQRLIEEPDTLQAQILKAFGLKIKGGVLQDA
jgi:transposase